MPTAGSWLVCNREDVAYYEHTVRLFMLSTHLKCTGGNVHVHVHV